MKNWLLALLTLSLLTGCQLQEVLGLQTEQEITASQLQTNTFQIEGTDYNILAAKQWEIKKEHDILAFDAAGKMHDTRLVIIGLEKNEVQNLEHFKRLYLDEIRKRENMTIDLEAIEAKPWQTANYAGTFYHFPTVKNQRQVDVELRLYILTTAKHYVIIQWHALPSFFENNEEIAEYILNSFTEV